MVYLKAYGSVLLSSTSNWHPRRSISVTPLVPAVYTQRRYDMRHEMLTQPALFCIAVMAKRVTLSQHFVMHVIPPLVYTIALKVGLLVIRSHSSLLHH
jgi:hypothetical protein